MVRFIYEQRPGESKSVDQVVTQGESVRGGRNGKSTDPGMKHETQRQKQCEKPLKEHRAGRGKTNQESP